MARLAMQGVLTMAQVVDWLTASQMRYQLGALPVLYALLETLQVRQLINRHCPEQRDVDYGMVAIVLVLNLFFNRIALLAYTLLQRQMQQRGIQLTTRRLIQRLEPLTIIETTCWDGSSLRRLTPDDPDLLMLLERVADALDDLVKAVIPANQPKALSGATATSPTHLLPDGMRC